MDKSEPADEVLAAPPPEQRAPSEDAPASGTPEGVGLHRLLDAAREREREARRALGLLNSIINLLPVGVTVQSEDGAVVLENDMAAQLGGAAEPSLGAAPDTSPAAKDAGEPPQNPAPITMEERADAANERTLLLRQRPVRIQDRSLLISTSFDFTEHKLAEIELSKRAYFDDLTGLPNRALIQEHVEHALISREPHARFALAFIDIDNFKHINDYYTHAIGDALLVKVAQRIAALIRPSDVLGRFSGDEFLLVLRPIAHDEELEQLIGNILQELKEPFLVEGFEILTSASIGVSVHPDHGISYEMLRRGADNAMHRVKAAAKGGAALFDTDMGRAMTVRMAQEQRLRLAVRDRRFRCAFQPKVDIRTQEVVGVEALIRLRDEDGVIQGPNEFIALAIELGLIDDLTHLALAEIMRSMELLDDTFGPHATISINVAAKQACNAVFMADFCEELKATHCASRFMVEVTEEAFLAKSAFQTDVVPMLREAGVRVSVDDFGTGYSSLATLADITADEIKIDRSFITDIHQRPRSQSVLKAIEALSDALGMAVIAEGVETFEEVAYLQGTTRIRYAQGYYFAKPLFLEDIDASRRAIGGSRGEANSRDRAPSRGRRMAPR